MNLTVKQAADATGKSKPTILRAIQGGKLSATRDEISGAWMIDAAELHRVYPPASAQQVRTDAMTQDVSVDEAGKAALLRRELALVTAERDRERAQLQEQIDDLRRRLDAEGEERRKLVAILTDQRQQPASAPAPAPAETAAPARRRWWHFGGKG